MLKFIIKRILSIIPTLFIVAAIAFFLIRLVPGDPAVMLVGDLQDAEILEEVRIRMGLYEPIYVQFLIWLGNILQGDFGTSIMTGEAVLPALMDRFLVTAQIVLLSVSVAMIIAIPLGMLAAWKQNSSTDFLITSVIILSLSLPSFWVGIMLILYFGVTLEWLPTVGYATLSEGFWLHMSYLVLPVSSLVLGEMATITRMMRSSTIETLRLEYITHARAKGIKESIVLRRHAFKNSFAPSLTVLGLILGHLLGGAAVTETVFSLPGLGRFMVESIYARDYPVVQGAMLLIAGIYVFVNLIIDLLYPIFDPRVKL
jgi:peptide/nickel transport system permease protein